MKSNKITNSPATKLDIKAVKNLRKLAWHDLMINSGNERKGRSPENNPQEEEDKIWIQTTQLLGSMLVFGDVDHFIGYFQYSTNFPVSRYIQLSLFSPASFGGISLRINPSQPSCFMSFGWYLFAQERIGKCQILAEAGWATWTYRQRFQMPVVSSGFNPSKKIWVKLDYFRR